MKLFIRLEALIDLGLKVSSDQLNLEVIFNAHSSPHKKQQSLTKRSKS